MPNNPNDSVVSLPHAKKVLHQVSAINCTQEKLDLLSGARFNVFNILGLHAKEVRTHSAFLGEMLNPRGRHGLKSQFLRRFLEVIGVDDFEAEDASVLVEKYAGPIDEDYLEGGRIDIYIRSRTGRLIFIENKIYAADQRNQLFRYYNYESKAKLIYLTLEGAKPSVWGAGTLSSEQYDLCSYRIHVIKWLELCYKDAAAYPAVRETIGQYINLISELTGNVPENYMKEEVKRLILHDRTNFESAAYLADMLAEVRTETIELLNKEFRARWTQMFEKDLCPLDNYCIWFDYQDNYFGFTASKGEARQICKDRALSPFAELARQTHAKFKSNEWWLGWKYFVKRAPTFQNLSTDVLFLMANSDEARSQLIEEIIDEVKPHYQAFKKLLSAYKRKQML